MYTVTNSGISKLNSLSNQDIHSGHSKDSLIHSFNINAKRYFRHILVTTNMYLTIILMSLRINLKIRLLALMKKTRYDFYSA